MRMLDFRGWCIFALLVVTSGWGQFDLRAHGFDLPEEVEKRESRQAVWPFLELRSPEIPVTNDQSWVRNPIDAFVLAKLEARGMTPAPPVTQRGLLRRLYFDLLGLPPTPQEIESFLSDPSPRAYADTIDRLLDDPRYGERWGRHWLDVVRYADTGGGGLDFPLQHIWRYRDYVIRAFNQDRPYDRFIKEQIAGDAYPQFGDEGRLGAGFLRLGVFVEGTREEMRRDLLNDIVSTTGSVFLGLTMECARCHDHKFDPIPAKDYYRLEAFFAAVTVRPEDVPFSQYEGPAELKKKGEQLEAELKQRKENHDQVKQAFRRRVEAEYAGLLTGPQEVKDTFAPVTDGDVARMMQRGMLFSKEEQEQFALLERQENGFGNLAELFKPIAYTATELLGASNTPEPNYPVAPATFILEGGDPKQQGAVVGPGFLSAVTGNFDPVDLEGVQFSRRKLLADWIASSDNPLTARVMVNRVWHYHFGEGLVSTTSDFGKNGSGTVHQDLIDWLAMQFIESGWSIKSLHRLILQSNTYQQSMNHPQSEQYERDDAKVRYLWRRQAIRLESETIRDSILAVSGDLNPLAGGPGFFPELDDELLKRASTWWQPSAPEERNRRSVYMMQKRAIVHPFLRVFDGANTNESCSVRGVTTVTPQVFVLFNSNFVHEKSHSMAERLVREFGGSAESQVEGAFQRALQRPPTDSEKSRSLTFVQQHSLAELCLVLLNLNEFVYLE